MKYGRIQFTDGSTEYCLSVSDSVGAAGVNKFEDIMLVQAMIALIAEWDVGLVGLGGHKIPEVTGEIDAVTYSAIERFQTRNKDRLIISVSDGRIDPTDYAARHQREKMMSINLLHQLATNTSRMITTNPNSDDLPYRTGLTGLNPALKTLINKAREEALR